MTHSTLFLLSLVINASIRTACAQIIAFIFDVLTVPNDDHVSEVFSELLLQIYLYVTVHLYNKLSLQSHSSSLLGYNITFWVLLMSVFYYAVCLFSYIEHCIVILHFQENYFRFLSCIIIDSWAVCRFLLGFGF